MRCPRGSGKWAAHNVSTKEKVVENQKGIYCSFMYEECEDAKPHNK